MRNIASNGNSSWVAIDDCVFRRFKDESHNSRRDKRATERIRVSTELSSEWSQLISTMEQSLNLEGESR